MSDKRDLELEKVMNARKIADSMAFKTGAALTQLAIILLMSIIFAQLSLGFNDISAIITRDFWASTMILLFEQYYAYYVIYDWLYTVFYRSSSELQGDIEDDSDLGLLVECNTYVKALDEDPDKLETALNEWNRLDKIEVYQNSIKKHITKLQDKINKQRRKSKPNKKKIGKFKESLAITKSLYDDENTLKDIEFVNIRGYKPIYIKDVCNTEKVYSNSQTRNSIVDEKTVKRIRFFAKGGLKLGFAIFGGLLIIDLLIGGEGFLGRFAYMLFIIFIQAFLAARDAYSDVRTIVIPNQRLRKKILVFATKYKPKKEESTLN